LLGNFSRRRLFGLTIAAAAVPLALIGLVPVLGAVVLFVVLIGALSGIAYATGFTIVGLEVDDDTRGRVFAFFQSSIQVILFTVIAVVPLLSYALTRVIVSLNGTGNVKIGNVTYASAGQNAVILLAAVVAFLLGMRAYRQMMTARACHCARTCGRPSATSRSRSWSLPTSTAAPRPARRRAC